MSNTYAIVNNGIVENVIVAEASNAEDSWVLVTEEYRNVVGVNSRYNSATGVFTERLTPARENELEAKKRLAESDWSQLPDVGLTTESANEFIAYRATLRSVATNPLDEVVAWPEKPIPEYLP